MNLVGTELHRMINMTEFYKQGMDIAIISQDFLSLVSFRMHISFEWLY